ncbi:hypothetical protein [Saccharicrinis sp. 156]|uniref:hypothetical protein n=1 Tax=Saccharicrinis sp. 156 TaxID=3417574 RepID=UPI003D339CE6
MKVSKNKLSAFQNLIEVVQTLNDEEIASFQKYLLEKRKITKNSKLFKTVLDLIGANETVDTINESSIKKEVETTISPNFNKLTENLYSRLLGFLSDMYKIDEWKKWQIEANDTLIEIEALCSRKLFSQAIALLLKLEDRLKGHSRYSKWIYDDISIYSRLANLKINLALWSNNLIEVDEIDEMLNNLLMLGEYFYNNSLNQGKVHLLKEHKYIGYQLLYRYFEENSRYEEAVDSINSVQYQAKKLYNDYPDLLNNIEAYFEFKKSIINAKNNKRHDLFKSSKNYRRKNNLLATLLQEEFITNQNLIPSYVNNDPNKGIDVQFYINLFFYTEKKIENIPDRLELNRAILLYLENKQEKSIEILNTLKVSKRIKSKDNPIFLDVLILELLCRIKNEEYDLYSNFRSIKGVLKTQNKSEFEIKAVKELENWSQLTQFGKRDYIQNEKETIESLRAVANKLEPIHQLIVYALSGEI